MAIDQSYQNLIRSHIGEDKTDFILVHDFEERTYYETKGWLKALDDVGGTQSICI